VSEPTSPGPADTTPGTGAADPVDPNPVEQPKDQPEDTLPPSDGDDAVEGDTGDKPKTDVGTD
jgi:hypothetical protein